MNLLKTLLIVILLQGTFAYSQIGIQTNTPDASSALDIVSTNKGLLIPRVTLTSSLANPSPVTFPATGLLVFNTGPNQPIGLYYWTGTLWNLFNTGPISSDYWGLTGNAGTTVGTNFIGTTDNVSFAINTNNTERMRVLNGNGEVVIGNTVPYGGDKFSVYGAAGNYGINSYGSDIGVYSLGNNYGYYGEGGFYSFRGEVNNTGLSAYFRNNNVSGNGVLNCGANIPGTYWLAPNNAGTVSLGNNGINTIGYNATGNGILASGSGNTSLITIATGTGGTFVGYHGVYGKGINSTVGTGIIGTGNNLGSYSTLLNGSGGAFYGRDGLFGKASYSSGIGVVGLGNNGTTYYYIPAGSGGAFTGFHGLYGQAIDAGGTGIIGCGNNSATAYYASGGSGGAFTGQTGSISTATSISGTGVIGVGNGGAYYLYTNGSGGAFTGDYCGIAGYGSLNNNNTVGVYGAYTNGGNNNTAKGVYGYSNGGRGYGVYGENTNGQAYGVWSQGRTGASGTKSFVIDHPDDPEHKTLVHFSIESNEVLNLYRGNVLLDNSGEAIIALPDYFLTINVNFSYDLTPIGQKAPDLFIKQEINDSGEFIIGGGQPGQKISWVVYGNRNDPYVVQNKEVLTDVVDKIGDEIGKYITPELYNQPPEKGIFYNPANNMQRSMSPIKSDGIPQESVQQESKEIKPVSAIDSLQKEMK